MPTRALQNLDPFVKVTELEQRSVDITLRLWWLAGQPFATKFDLTSRIDERFDQAGISIPHPPIELTCKEPREPVRRLQPRFPRGSHHH